MFTIDINASQSFAFTLALLVFKNIARVKAALKISMFFFPSNKFAFNCTEILFQNLGCFFSQLALTCFLLHILLNTYLKNPSTIIFFFVLGRQGITIKPSKEEHACQRKLYGASSSQRKKPQLALPARLPLQSQAACLYIEPSGDHCGWRRTAFEWMALCVAARGVRER